MASLTAVLLLIGCGAVHIDGTPAQQSADAPRAVAAVRDVANNPQRFVDQPITIRGVLDNKSPNYFSRPRLVLKDQSGMEVNVRPWAPTSDPPPAPGTDDTRPTLATFLGKQVELKAVLKRNPGDGETLALVVEEIVVVPQP
jgi:hypothetical protein